MKRITLILLLFLSCFTIKATDYYIATAANGGDDAKTGLVGQPCLTLAHIATHAITSGDTIHVGVGTFIETTTIPIAIGVSIIGAGATSIIHSHYASHSIALITLNSSAANPVDGNQSISYLQFDGDALTAGIAVSVKYRNNVSIHHCTFVDFEYKGIVLSASDNVFPAPPSYNYATNNQIYDCSITNCSGLDGANYYGFIDIMAQGGTLIYNNTLVSAGRVPNGETIKALWCKGLQIYSNNFTTPTDNNDGDWNFAIEYLFGVGGNDVYGNIFNGAGCCDFVNMTKGTYSYGLKIHDNSYSLPDSIADAVHGQEPINLEERGNTEYVYIYNNYIHNFPRGIYILSTTDGEHGDVHINDIYIYNNVMDGIGAIEQNYASGIYLYSYDRVAPYVTYWDNINIWNNTMVGRATGLNTFMNGINMRFDGSDVFTNFDIKNNIIAHTWDHALRFYKSTGSPSIDVLNIENNIFYDIGSSPDIDYTAGITITNNVTQNNLTSNPLFKSTSYRHLQHGSPAINAGIDVGLTVDGAYRPIVGLPDIGAYEFGAKILKSSNKFAHINNKIVRIQ